MSQSCIRNAGPPVHNWRGCRASGERFTPHVTLAYFGAGEQAGHHLAQFMASHSLLRSAPFAVEHFSLFSPVTRPPGSLYRIESDYPLPALV